MKWMTMGAEYLTLPSASAKSLPIDSGMGQPEDNELYHEHRKAMRLSWLVEVTICLRLIFLATLILCRQNVLVVIRLTNSRNIYCTAKIPEKKGL